MKTIRLELFLLFFLISVFSVSSCKDRKKQSEIAKIVTEWTGKRVLFSENVLCYVSGKNMFSELCNEYFFKNLKL